MYRWGDTGLRRKSWTWREDTKKSRTGIKNKESKVKKKKKKGGEGPDRSRTCEHGKVQGQHDHSTMQSEREIFSKADPKT